MSKLSDNEAKNILWLERYHYACPVEQGKIVKIDGIGDKDAYNPSLCKYDDVEILAFRCEERRSQVTDPINYHPSILFAIKNDKQNWSLTQDVLPFDMLEDPIFMKAKIDGKNRIVFGGVRAKLLPDRHVDVDTEVYAGESLEKLYRTPFVTVRGLKDVHLCQLPNGQFLLCRRPIDEHGIGYIVLHIIDNLEDLESINSKTPPIIAEIRSPRFGDWVGVNNVYILTDKNGVVWVGLLAHIGSNDENNNKHYAATTYKIKIDDLMNGNVPVMEPHVIATRSCFAKGPKKKESLEDVIFPGSLELLDDNQYRLWVGLSDARIGIINITNPFKLDLN